MLSTKRIDYLILPIFWGSFFDATIAHYAQFSLEHQELTQFSQSVFNKLISSGKFNENATDMDLSHNNITSIDSDVMLQFKHLRDFTMNDNGNYEFPEHGEFLHNTDITRVRLRNCGLRQINDLTFRRMTKLMYLHLAGNKIDIISPNAFQHNKKLDTLNLSHNRLKRINPHGRLLHLSNLMTLQMNHNQEFSLAANEIHSKFLLRFECNGCANRRLSKDTMQRFPYLTRLNLDENGIENLPADIFQRNKFLEELTLSGNPLNSLNIESETLIKLVCHNCTELQAVDASTFQGLKNLEEVDLTNSRVKVVKKDAFKSMAGLKHLYLENNDLQELDTGIVESLRTLCLGGNDFRPSYQNTQMTQAYRSRGFLKANCDRNDNFEYSLENVTLASGKVLSLPRKGPIFPERVSTVVIPNYGLIYVERGFFSAKYPNMKQLVMDDNVKYEFPQDLPFAEHSLLETFSCQRCNTKIIYNATFADLPNLKTLNLNSTGLHAIDLTAFTANANLQTLLIENNQLSLFPHEIVATIPKLLELSMSGNREFKVPDRQIFLYHERLQRFNCNWCGFRQIDGDTFSRLPHLTHLELQNNRIGKISSSAFENNVKLESVNLNSNNLKRVPSELVVSLPHLSKLCLEFNPNYEFVRADDDGVLRETILSKELSLGCGCSDNCFVDKLPIVTTTTTQSTTTTKELITEAHPRILVAKKIDEEKQEPLQEQMEPAEFGFKRHEKVWVESKPMKMISKDYSPNRSNLQRIGYFFWVLVGLVQVLYL